VSNRNIQPDHKKTHKSQNGILQNIFTPKVVSHPDPATGHFNPFPTFSYTGALRPVYPLSPRREVPKTIKLPDYSKDGIPRSEQVFVNRNKIAILNEKEIEGMRKVCRLGREVLDIAARAAKPGVTTDYIDEIVHKACMERDVSTGTLRQAESILTTCSPIHHPSTIATFPSRFARPLTRSFATVYPISESSRTATS
jgi:methionyl aminopeptidase